jgi:hypothetical protein
MVLGAALLTLVLVLFEEAKVHGRNEQKKESSHRLKAAIRDFERLECDVPLGSCRIKVIVP